MPQPPRNAKRNCPHVVGGGGGVKSGFFAAMASPSACCYARDVPPLLRPRFAPQRSLRRFVCTRKNNVGLWAGYVYRIGCPRRMILDALCSEKWVENTGLLISKNLLRPHLHLARHSITRACMQGTPPSISSLCSAPQSVTATVRK